MDASSLRRQRLCIGGVIGVEPGALDPRHVRQPRHRPRMLVAGDEVGKVAAVLEEERRSRRRRPDMEARHRAEEVRPGDALRRREDRGQGVDEADGDVVAIDLVAPRRGLAARSGDHVRHRPVGIEQRRGESRRHSRTIHAAQPTAWILPAETGPRVAVEDRPGGGSLGLEHRPVGDLAVPLDQRRHRAAAADHAVVERPDRVRRPGRRGCRSAAARPRRPPAPRGRPGGSRRRARAGSRRDSPSASKPWLVAETKTLLTSSSRPQPVRRTSSRRKSVSLSVESRKHQVGRRVLEQDRPADRVLHLGDVVGDARERRRRVGQRQQVVEEGRRVRRPGKVLGDQRRLVALDERREAREMRPGRAAAARRSTCRPRAATPDGPGGCGRAPRAAGRRRPCSSRRGPRRSRPAARRRGSPAGARA